MDVRAIHTELKHHKTRNFYIFTGDEWAMQQIYINQIVKLKKQEFANTQYLRIDRAADILSKLSNRGFIETRYVFTLRDDKEFMSEEKLQEQIKKKLGNNCLILLLTSPDKRTKFWKNYYSDVVIFEPLNEKSLIEPIGKKINLSEKNIRKLIQICECDYGRILLEMDKIIQYMIYAEEHGYDIDCDESFTILLEDNSFYIPPQDAVFDFVDAVLDFKPKLAFDLYEQCKAVGEATLVIISNLYTSTKAVLQVQSCNSRDVSKTTGLTGWQIQNANKHRNVYTNGSLLYIMELCVKMEQGIKTGKIDERYAVDYILCNAMY